MQKTMGVWFLAITMTFGFGLRSLCAQEENKPAAEDEKSKTERPVKPVHPYRVDFSISELADGKKVNIRHYSMLLTSGPWSQIKIGSRVPVAESVNSFQYLDVGTSIDCEIGEQGEDISLDIRSDFSNFSSPEDQHNPHPIVRQIKINGRTLTSSGKPAIIGTVDDPSSNRQFELEATATKLK